MKNQSENGSIMCQCVECDLHVDALYEHFCKMGAKFVDKPEISKHIAPCEDWLA